MTHQESVEAAAMEIHDSSQELYPREIINIILRHLPAPPEPTGQTVRQAIEELIDEIAEFAWECQCDYREIEPDEEQEKAGRGGLRKAVAAIITEHLSARGMADLCVPQWVTKPTSPGWWMYRNYKGNMQLTRVYEHDLEKGDWFESMGAEYGFCGPFPDKKPRCLAPAPPSLESDIGPQRATPTSPARLAAQVKAVVDQAWNETHKAAPPPLDPATPVMTGYVKFEKEDGTPGQGGPAGVHKERCPKCGSHRVAVSDEAMVCYDCGQWFQPKEAAPSAREREGMDG